MLEKDGLRVGGWANGWIHQNKAIPWLHPASWYLTFDTRYLPNPYQTPSRHSQDTLQKIPRYTIHTDTIQILEHVRPCLMLEKDRLRVGGWFHQNTTTCSILQAGPCQIF